MGYIGESLFLSDRRESECDSVTVIAKSGVKVCWFSCGLNSAEEFQ